jgi:SAM-dependent methyltransferase
MMNPIAISQETDPFGQALWDHHHGHPARIALCRDDGLVTEHDAALYFAGPEAWDPSEAEALKFAHGRVLDIGCGAGRHALVLQERGLSVVGLDLSPLAAQVARLRGMRRAVVGSAMALPFAPTSFDTFLLLGNNLGLAGNVEGTATVLRQLRTLARPGAVVIASSRDPAVTDNPVHLAYHECNRARGRPIGQMTLRMEYGGQVGPWFDFLILAPDEVDALAEQAGWRVERVFGEGQAAFTVVLVARGQDNISEKQP